MKLSILAEVLNDRGAASRTIVRCSTTGDSYATLN